MNDWRRALLKAIGAPATPSNLRFLTNWQRWEGGHTNNSAKFNWLNTTQESQGAIGEINSVGVKRFNNFQNGIIATASTLMNGRYDDIVQAMIKGNPYKYDVSSGLQTWVSGSPTGNPGYAQKVLGGSAAPKAAQAYTSAGRGAKALAVDPPAAPKLSSLMKMAFADDPEFLQLLGSFSPPAKQRPASGGKAQPYTSASLQPGGGWGGSQAIAAELRDITGLPVTSEKRDTKMTASGGVSDHWTGSKTSYAYDLGGTTKQMDAAAKKLMASLGVNWDGKSGIVKNINKNGYRIQVIYRSNVGGNHYDHIHIGVRKL